MPDDHYCPFCGADDQTDRLETQREWICGTCFEVHPKKETMPA